MRLGGSYFAAVGERSPAERVQDIARGYKAQARATHMKMNQVD